MSSKPGQCGDPSRVASALWVFSDSEGAGFLVPWGLQWTCALQRTEESTVPRRKRRAGVFQRLHVSVSSCVFSWSGC